MGSFSKAAESFLKKSNEEDLDWRASIEDQKNRFRKVAPLSEDIASGKAHDILKHLKQLAYSTGYNARQKYREDDDEGVGGIPGRSYQISYPSSKRASSLIMDPLKEIYRESRIGSGVGAEKKRKRSMRVTEDPRTLPGFLPAAALTVPSAFSEGFSQSDADVSTRHHSELDAQIQKARDEFEAALRNEFTGKEASNAGELIDGLADKFLKSADGELATALNTYLAAAALLGTGAHKATKNWADSRDPKRQRRKMLERAIKRRSRETAIPTITME